MHPPAEESFEQIEALALATKRADEFIHVGLLYRNDNGELRISHLAWHHVHCDSAEFADYYWIASSLGDIHCEQVAAYLSHIAESSAQIPYSIRLQGQYFDESINYVAKEPGEGLTCGTFILVVVEEALSLSLIERGTWPVGRPEDVDWAEKILSMLANGDQPASADHIEAQRGLIPEVVRYRPEEVAAAFEQFNGRALRFEEIVERALVIKNTLIAPA